MANYQTQQQAVDSVRPGWRIVGSRQELVDGPNPAAQTDPLAPKTIKVPSGNTVLSIQGPNNEPDEMTVGWTPDESAKGGNAITILQGPQKNPSTAGKPSDTSKWTPVYRIPGDASSGQVAQWDPVNNQYHEMQTGGQASGQYSPVYRNPTDATSGVVALVDTGDKSFHPVAGDPAAKATGQYTNVIDPNDPQGQRVIGMVDTGDKVFHPVSASGANRQVINTGTAVYTLDDQGKPQKILDVDKNSPYQAVNIDNVLYRFDPNEKDPTKALTRISDQNPLPQSVKDAGGNTLTLQQQADGTQKYVLPPGVERAQQLTGSGTTSPNLIWYDSATGQEIKREPNPNYQAPRPTVPPANTTSPNILIEDPDHPGQLKWVPNQGQVKASDALKNLASTLSGQVVSGDISVDEAKTIIDAANQRMTAEGNQATTAVNAAGQLLQTTREGATAGAGILQQRAQAASGMLQNILGQATGAKNLMSVPSGLGENLVGGIQGWTADLMGGQGVLDSAARMVQAADPQNDLSSPQSHVAIGVLTQMLQKYQDATGQPHPAVAATNAAAQSAAGGGMAAPATLFNPQASTAAMNAAGYQDTPQGRAAAQAAGQGNLLQMPTPATFQAPQTYYSGPPPSSNYGNAVAYTGGVPPWLAQPGPAFIAPPTLPQTAPLTV